VVELERPGRQADDGRPIEMIVAPVATREPGRLEFAASGQSKVCRFQANTTSSSELGNTTTDSAIPRDSRMTDKHNVGPIAESAPLLRPLITHACWSSAKILDTTADIANQRIPLLPWRLHWSTATDCIPVQAQSSGRLTSA
jgi:hypothetical protein